VPALVLDLLKYVFLAVLYIFVARAVRAVYIELRPSAMRRERQTPAPASSRPPTRRKRGARKVAVIEGNSHKGRSFDLGSEFVIGRADRCHLVLDDPYVSQVHARIYAKDGETYMIEDMGSTNGTYVNRKRITSTTELQRGDRVKIGKTVLELRK
jgi:pSer/pThr/pTyr-binding forkhead associated (FHA) protein